MPLGGATRCATVNKLADMILVIYLSNTIYIYKKQQQSIGSEI